MATREERAIVVDIISATDLVNVRKFGKQEAYAVAYIYPRDKKSTKVDKHGGLNPVWNSKLTLLADEDFIQQKQAAIMLEIHCPSTFGTKLVGAARISLSDLSIDNNTPQFMALALARPSKMSQGTLNVSVAFGEKRTVQAYQPQFVQNRFGGAGIPGTYNQAPQGYYPQQAYAQQTYGYPQQPYGYPQQGYYQQQPPRRTGGGLGGAGLGLGAGLLGGLLVGDAIGNLGDNDTYIDNNYYGDDGGDFGGGDFGGDF